MLSFQLFARAGTLGALNLYSSKPKGFTSDSQTLGSLFATHAAMALGQAQHAAHLHPALATRDVIGQAKGMLMERFGLDAQSAFSMLVRSSQETNLKLVEVARWVGLAPLGWTPLIGGVRVIEGDVVGAEAGSVYGRVPG